MYFSDKENGPRPQVTEKISIQVWKGLRAIINKWYNDNAFCGMGLGQDEQFVDLLTAEIPSLSWPLNADAIPQVNDVFDLLEFCYKNVACTTRDHHDRYRQYNYSPPEREIGQTTFREDINLIFERNGIIFELQGSGSIIRLVPREFQKQLQQIIFHTGDTDLDELLNISREKFINPRPEIRKDSLEKLWDAWERLKTLENPNDKSKSISKILEQVTPEINFRARLDSEGKELSDIGNKFRIRHHEMDKIPIESSDHVDYLFFRMFSLIYLILKSTNRIK